MSDNPLYGQSFVTIQGLALDGVERIMHHAREMQTDVENRQRILRLPGSVMVRAFYEPSTRTATSFSVAMQRLGGHVTPIDGGMQYSSAIKGETFEDTMRTFSEMADVVVLRHPEVGAAARAVAVSRVPVINAGDGIGEHPTQALLDLYTIRRRLSAAPNPREDLVVTMLGDLKNGRTVHSLVRLLGLMYGKKLFLNLVSPDSLRMPEDVRRDAKRMGGHYNESTTLTNKFLRATDVLYVTRVQKERFETAEEYEAVQGSYIINRATLENSRGSLVLMHPFPRVNELSTDLDHDPRAAYFDQIHNGVYVRMALLDLILRPSA